MAVLWLRHGSDLLLRGSPVRAVGPPPCAQHLPAAAVAGVAWDLGLTPMRIQLDHRSGDAVGTGLVFFFVGATRSGSEGRRNRSPAPMSYWPWPSPRQAVDASPFRISEAPLKVLQAAESYPRAAHSPARTFRRYVDGHGRL